MRKIAEASATGDVTTDSTYLHTVSLTGDSSSASLVITSGGSGGTKILELQVVANTTASVDLGGVLCSGGIHATFSGTGPSGSFVYE